jgi:glycosyltransferase involved in cell wall biosynthesis
MITVIVPAYNEEKLIGACLESLAAQTPLPDEILIVNNASTDRTPEIAEQFIARKAATRRGKPAGARPKAT